MKLNLLSSLLESRESIDEGKKSDADFAGISAVITDALDDLTDKLGKGGSLNALMKSSGASKYDTIKDKGGKTIVAQINTLTAEYKSAIKKLMTEAEVLVGQMNESMLTEVNVSNKYDDSSEFTDEFYGLSDHINKLKKAMKAPRWLSYFRTTDTNYGTSMETPARQAISALTDLETQFFDIDQEFQKTT